MIIKTVSLHWTENIECVCNNDPYVITEHNVDICVKVECYFYAKKNLQREIAFLEVADLID